MKFVCDRCKTKYTIADEKVRQKVLKIRCKNCQQIIVVREPQAGEDAGSYVGPLAAAPEPEEESGARAFEKAFEASFGKDIESAGLRPAAPRRPGLRSPDADEATQIVQMPPEFGRDASPLLRKAAAPAAQNTDEEWYVAIDGQQYGPMSFQELSARFRRGEASGQSYVWREGFEDWRKAAGIKELKPFLKPVPPPPPPPPPSDALRAKRPATASLAGLTPSAGSRSLTPPPPSPDPQPPPSPQRPAAVIAPAIPAPAPAAAPSAVFAPSIAPSPPAPVVAPAVAATPPSPVFAPAPLAAPAPMAPLAVASPAAVQAVGFFPPEVAAASAGGSGFFTAGGMAIPASGGSIVAPLPPPKSQLWKTAVVAGGVGGAIAVAVFFLLSASRPNPPPPVVAAVTAPEPKPEPKPEPRVEPKPEPKPEPAVEPPPEPKAEETDAGALAAAEEKKRTVHGPRRVKPKAVVAQAPAKAGGPLPLGYGGAGDEKPTRSFDPGRLAGGAGRGPTLAANVNVSDHLGKLVRQHRSGIKVCYEKALKRDDSLKQAKVTVSVRVSSDGRVRRVGFDGSVGGSYLGECLSSAIRRWSFPSTGEAYQTDFPLVLQGS